MPDGHFVTHNAGVAGSSPAPATDVTPALAGSYTPAGGGLFETREASATPSATPEFSAGPLEAARAQRPPVIELQRLLVVVATARQQGWSLATLPPREQMAVQYLPAGIRAHMAVDPHVGPLLEGSIGRVETAIAAGALPTIQTHDISVLNRFLGAVRAAGEPVRGGRR